jgi:hypothetical protein
MSQSPSAKDLLTAEQTLNFLAERLLVQRFLLKAVGRKRKEFEYQEAEARESIRTLVSRISYELDKYPELTHLFRDDQSNDSAEDSAESGDAPDVDGGNGI